MYQKPFTCLKNKLKNTLSNDWYILCKNKKTAENQNVIKIVERKNPQPPPPCQTAESGKPIQLTH